MEAGFLAPRSPGQSGTAVFPLVAGLTWEEAHWEWRMEDLWGYGP